MPSVRRPRLRSQSGLCRIFISLPDIMNRKDIRVDFIELHILHHADGEPLYGLWMIEELATHGYRLGASSLYPRFHRLEDAGFVSRSERVVDGRLRKYYRLTSAGRRYLALQKRRLIELVSEALTEDELRSALEKRIARKQKKAEVRTPHSRKSATAKL